MRIKIWGLFIAIMALALAAAAAIFVSQSAGQQTDSVAAPAHKFSLPIIPSTLSSDEQRVEYLIDHYWDGYNMCDSVLLHDAKQTRTAFIGYITLLTGYDSPQCVRASVNKTLGQSFDAGTQVFDIFSEMFERYLYEPNSPYQNDEVYMYALESIVSNPLIDQIEKIRPQAQLEVVKRNRVGHKSTDFAYRLRGGKRAKMHNIEAEYLILYFNNPDCHDCERVKNYFVESETINALYASGRLKVLSIYPDPTLELWEASHYPPMMINSYDEHSTITNEQLYDLKAIPTLYLLGGQKEVLLKDAPIEVIEAWLARNVN